MHCQVALHGRGDNAFSHTAPSASHHCIFLHFCNCLSPFYPFGHCNPATFFCPYAFLTTSSSALHPTPALVFTTATLSASTPPFICSSLPTVHFISPLGMAHLKIKLRNLVSDNYIALWVVLWVEPNDAVSIISHPHT